MELREFIRNDMILFLEDAQEHQLKQRSNAAASETDFLLHTSSGDDVSSTSESSSSSSSSSTKNTSSQSSSSEAPQKEIIREIIREVPVQQPIKSQVKDMHLEQSLFPSQEAEYDLQMQSQHEQPLLHTNLAQTNQQYQQAHSQQSMHPASNFNQEQLQQPKQFQQGSAQPIIVQQQPFDTSQLRESIEKEILEKLQKSLPSQSQHSSQESLQNTKRAQDLLHEQEELTKQLHEKEFALQKEKEDFQKQQEDFQKQVEEKYKNELLKQTAVLEEQKKALQKEREELDAQHKQESLATRESQQKSQQQLQAQIQQKNELLEKEKSLEQEIAALRTQMNESLTHKQLDEKTVLALKQLHEKSVQETKESLQQQTKEHLIHDEQYKKQIELLQNEIKQIRATTASLLKKHTSPPQTVSSQASPTHIHIHSSRDQKDFLPIRSVAGDDVAKLQNSIQQRFAHKSPSHEELERIVLIHDRLEIIHALLDQKRFTQVKDLYEELKEETKKIVLHSEEKQAIIKHLQSIARVLTSLSGNRFEDVGDQHPLSKKSQAVSSSSHKTSVLHSLHTQSMDDYVKALEALQEKNKAKALRLFIALYKKNPSNKAIRSRLEESLQLSSSQQIRKSAATEVTLHE